LTFWSAFAIGVLRRKYVYSFLDTSPALHESRRNGLFGNESGKIREQIETKRVVGNESRRNEFFGRTPKGAAAQQSLR
jgi:hypothetical protein